jgi:ElaB/YqjD/DUF883 family membrane-anchored ribosome-binding protein
MENTLDGKINGTRDGITPIGQALRADAHTAIDHAADRIPQATDRLAASAHQGVDTLADGAESVSQRLATRGKQLGGAYRQCADTGRGYVRSSPALSVLLAAAAGYGLSKLLGSRSK